MRLRKWAIAFTALFACQLMGSRADREESSRSVNSIALTQLKPLKARSKPEVVVVIPPRFCVDGDEVVTEIPITNDQDQSVVFQKIQTTCGCSSATLSQMSLQPGQTTNLRVAIDSRGRIGPQSINVTLLDDNSQPWRYRVETTLFVPVEFDVPNAFLPLGQLVGGSELNREIGLILRGGIGLHLPSEFRSTSSSGGVTIGLPTTSQSPVYIEHGCQTRKLSCSVKWKVPTIPGDFSGWIDLQYSYNGSNRKTRLSYCGYVTSQFDISPKYVVFTVDNTYSSRRILLRRTDGLPLRITKSISSFDGVTAHYTNSNEAKVVVVELRVRPDLVEKNISGEVEFQTNLAAQPILKVPFAVLRKQGG